MTRTPHKDLEDVIMGKIHHDEVKMKPQWYFIIGSVVLFLSIFLLFFITILFLTITWYRLRVGGPFGYLAFGSVGWKAFIQTFPLLPFILALFGFFFGASLLKKYDFSYKKNFTFILAGTVLSLALAAFFVDYVGINEHLSQRRQLRPLYRDALESEEWLMGKVIVVQPPRLFIHTFENRDVVVVWTEHTLIPFSDEFQPGQFVRVIGEWEGPEFVAKGIGGGRRGKNF